MPDMAPEITMVVRLLAQDGREKKLYRALEASVEPTRMEDGCRMYRLHRSASDPKRFLVYERWASEEAVESHESTEHMRVLQEALDELLEEHSIERYEQVAPEPSSEEASDVRDGDETVGADDTLL